MTVIQIRVIISFSLNFFARNMKNQIGTMTFNFTLSELKLKN